LRREPVTKVLLVEAWLAATRSITLLWPVPRRVRCECFINEDELSIDKPKFELCVRDDESSRSRILRRGDIQLDGDGGNPVV